VQPEFIEISERCHHYVVSSVFESPADLISSDFANSGDDLLEDKWLKNADKHFFTLNLLQAFRILNKLGNNTVTPGLILLFAVEKYDNSVCQRFFFVFSRYISEGL